MGTHWPDSCLYKDQRQKPLKAAHTQHGSAWSGGNLPLARISPRQLHQLLNLLELGQYLSGLCSSPCLDWLDVKRLQVHCPDQHRTKQSLCRDLFARLASTGLPYMRPSPLSSCNAYSDLSKQLSFPQISARPRKLCPAVDQAVPECACKQQTRELQQVLARNVVAHARGAKGSSRRSNRSSGPPQEPTAAAAGSAAAADVSGLLQALVQLASRSTIMLGSYQAYVSNGF